MSKNEISISTAKTWAKKWQSENPKHCKAFLVPSINLIQALESMNVLVKQSNGDYKLNNVGDSYIRTYLGVDEAEKEGFGEKLMVVGTNKDGKGIYRDIIQGEKEDKSKSAGSGVFDFSQPCPSDCDVNSPLNNP